MKACKPVPVPRAAFLFCKCSVAVILWLAFFMKLKWLVIFSFGILALSAVLKIQRAPMILLYSCTFGRLFKSGNEILDEHAMSFAHTLGAVLNLVCLLFLYIFNGQVGWVLLFFVAIAKTAGAMGFCSALKLYGCLSSGGCCRFAGNKNA